MEARAIEQVSAWVEYRSGAALLYNPFRRTGLILSYVLQHRGGRSMNEPDNAAAACRVLIADDHDVIILVIDRDGEPSASFDCWICNGATVWY